VSSKIVSKVLVDEGVLSGRGEKVFFLVLVILKFIGSDVGKGVEAIGRSGGDGDTGDNILRAVRDVAEGVVLDVVKGRPDRSGGWGILKLGGLRSRGDGLEDTGGNVKGAWIVPSIVRTLQDLEDGGSGVRNVLLINIIKGRPGGDGDMGKSGGGDDGGLGSVERHLFNQLAPL